MNFTPDEDGVIDLTTLDDDLFIDVAAELDTELETLSVSPRTNSYVQVPL